MITGGIEQETQKSVEVLRADGTSWCELPDLPLNTYFHTQSEGDVQVCGGAVDGAPTTCQTFDSSTGNWIQEPKIDPPRTAHFSWKVKFWEGGETFGLILMGGTASPKSSEIVYTDRESEAGFRIIPPTTG